MQGSVNQEMLELRERLRRIEQRVAALVLRQSLPAKPGSAPAAATVIPDRRIERRERIIIYLRKKAGLANSIARPCPGLSARAMAWAVLGARASARTSGAS